MLRRLINEEDIENAFFELEMAVKKLGLHPDDEDRVVRCIDLRLAYELRQFKLNEITNERRKESRSAYRAKSH